MNKYIKTGIGLFLPFLMHSQVYLTNNGGNIKINNNVDVQIANGGIHNKNSGTINNDGNIYLDRDYDQNDATYSGGTASWLWFEGSADQKISGDPSISIDRIKADNSNKVILQTEVFVSTDADLTNNGSIELGTNNLIMAPAANISNYDQDHYIITNDYGHLQREVSGTDVVFPVGRSTFNPATLNNIGTTDNFTVRVFEEVLNEGTTGFLDTSDVVDRTWMIDENTAGGSDVSMTLQWEEQEEMTNFDRGNCGIAHHISDTLWDNPSHTAATNAGGTFWEQTRDGFTSFSPFVVRSTNAGLPVELLEFNAIRKSHKTVKIDWSTVSETNNLGFHVQRMLDNETNFNNIAWKDGKGTVSSLNNYTIVDKNPYPFLSYYRLKQVDFDGSFSYSDIKIVEGKPKESSDAKSAEGQSVNNPVNHTVSIFPNPVADELNIVIQELNEDVSNCEIQIINIDGKILYEYSSELQAYKTYKVLNIDKLIPGMYIMNIKMNNGKNVMHKFIKK